MAVSCLTPVAQTGLELLIGATRLGNLLALLDREVVPAIQAHLMWVGRGANCSPFQTQDLVTASRYVFRLAVVLLQTTPGCTGVTSWKLVE
jgi:hypothetical protein